MMKLQAWALLTLPAAAAFVAGIIFEEVIGAAEKLRSMLKRNRPGTVRLPHMIAAYPY